uniref:Uncharacterized protein n=1 Tax=Anopheles atroparvus TaxID=41427 RepID=A0A182J5J1_ANOAO
MDKVVAKFANFKDIVNLNLFLYELLSIMADVSPAYGAIRKASLGSTMNCRLFFLLLSVAVAAVKGNSSTGEGMWAKYAKKSLLTTPVKAPVQQPEVQEAVPQARSVPTKSARHEPVVEPVVEPEAEPAEKVETPSIILDYVPPKREIPLFAKTILGDPQHPKLARVEDMRKFDLRSNSYTLELPNKHTIPLTKQLLEKTSELLRLYQEIQEESNGFVEDVEKHNANEATDYIGHCHGGESNRQIVREINKTWTPGWSGRHSASARSKMQFKFYGLSFTVFALLLGALTTRTHAVHVVEYIDVPNKIAWLPEGTDLVLRFLISISDSMISQYRLVLERIKTVRATLQSYPPAYNSIAMFYDNDIQHPSEKGSHKGPLKHGSGEAFKAAFETIKKFAGRRAQPYVKH